MRRPLCTAAALQPPPPPWGGPRSGGSGAPGPTSMPQRRSCGASSGRPTLQERGSQAMLRRGAGGLQLARKGGRTMPWRCCRREPRCPLTGSCWLPGGTTLGGGCLLTGCQVCDHLRLEGSPYYAAVVARCLQTRGWCSEQALAPPHPTRRAGMPCSAMALPSWQRCWASNAIAAGRTTTGGVVRMGQPEYRARMSDLAAKHECAWPNVPTQPMQQ